MKTLLVVNSSGRVTRSITRRLTRRFADKWQAETPHGSVVQRDLTQAPPPVVNESWIAAAFSDPAELTETTRATLQLSETLLDELIAADAVVIGAPVYNFGMPAQLKAYFDQIVRVGRAFAFDAQASDPYRPLLLSKPVVVITSAGDGALLPGGALAHLNHLEPHLHTVLGFIGLTDLTFIRIGYDEYGDDRLKHSLAAAESAVDALSTRLSASMSHEADPAKLFSVA